MTRLTIRLLGAPVITIDDEPIEVDTRKAIALLVYLAVTRQTHRRSALAVLFWPDSDQERGRTALRRTLATLNKALGKGWIEADRTTIGLNEDMVGLEVDVTRLREIATAVSHPSDPDCDNQPALLREAAELYRGDFLQGFTLTDSAAFDDWQFFQVEQSKQEIGTIWQKLVYCLTQAGEFEEAIGYARQWLALDLLHERPHRQLMQLYAWAGQRAAALRQYNECTRILDEEIGVPPQPETTAVYEQILNKTLPMPSERVTAAPRLVTAVAAEPALTTPAPPLPHSSAPARPRYNLPTPAVPFVGRERELREVNGRLDDPNCRLLTIIGPGGVGKTRLALEVAGRWREQYRHGVFFVPLTDISDTDYLDALLAETVYFAFYGRGDQRTQLLDYLRDKEMLLLFDNFEHVLDGVDLITAVLKHAPQIKILVTTQERLNLREEWLYEIDVFSCPQNGDVPESSSSYQLFLQRARQVQPQFAPAASDQLRIAQICRAVGGLALGIELAASWIRILSPDEIVSQMTQNLDFLTTSLRDVPDRHRSLRAIFSYSWELLTDQERETFARLAVFCGGFQIPSALTIAQISLPSLLTLADKSLLRQTISGRYEIPAVLRAYAQDRFENHAQSEAIKARHAGHYLCLLAEQAHHLKGGGQKAALQEIRSEMENIRAAWREALTGGQINALLDALPALLLFYEMQSWFGEGLQVFSESADRPLAQKSQRLQGQLLMAQGACLFRLARFEEAEARLLRGLPMLRSLDDKSAVALTLYYLGTVVETNGRYAQAGTYLEESLSLYRAVNEQWGAAAVLNALGNVAFVSRDYNASRQHYQESLLLRRHLGDQHGVGVCYHNLGNVPLVVGEYAEAKRLYRESLRLHRELRDNRGIGHALNNIGYAAWLQGSIEEADRHLHESLVVLTEVGDQRGIAHAQQNLGHVAMANGRFDEALSYYEESRFLFQSIGDRAGMAGVLVNVGDVARQQGQAANAEQRYKAAVEMAQEIGATTVVLDALAGLGQVNWQAGEFAQGWGITAVVAGHPDTSLPTQQQITKLRAQWEEKRPLDLPPDKHSLEEWVATILNSD